MIRLLHGENQVLSRKRLSEIIALARKNEQEVVVFKGSGLVLEDVRKTLESQTLFGKSRLVVWENFLSQGKSKEKDKILSYLEEGKFDNDLVIWEGREIKGKICEEVQSELFKLPSLLFKFLELFSPKDKLLALSVLKKLEKSEELEIIFYMLVRQLRLLLMASFGDDLKELPVWQQSKIRSQAEKFTHQKLLAVYNHLLEIDYDQKTSASGYSLGFKMEFLLINL